MYASTRFASQSTSGWIFQTSYCSLNSTRCASLRVRLCSRRMPEIHASNSFSARLSGSTLRTWQQRSGFDSQRFGPSCLCCSATVITSGRTRSSPYLATSFSRVSYVSAKKRPVSSSMTGMSMPSSLTMCTSTDDCFCHEHVRQSLEPKRSYAQRRQSAAVIDSTSGSCRLTLATEQHLLQRVAAEPETERLERDDFLGRDVPEVDARAEVADE